MIKNDVNDIYLDILKELTTNGIITGKRKELVFLTFTLTDMNKNILFFPFAQRNWPWILRECSDRIFNVKNPGTSFKYSKNWENRIEESGLYSYHYADRLDEQMKNVLAKKIQSRDKIVQVWQPGDYEMDGRQPCTITMQPVMENDGKISLIVYMRNNDMINIFPSDVFIHSTYFKYWCTYFGHEYKNLYWVSAVAYYQKKRDTLNFTERLMEQWNTDYTSVPSTKWTKETIEDLQFKEQLESDMENTLVSDIESKISAFKTDYIREWFIIMLMANYKHTDKDKYKQLLNTDFKSEFKQIKESLFK